MSRESYWYHLAPHKKRLVLTWILALRTMPHDQIKNTCPHGIWLNGAGVDADALPAFLFSINTRSIELEMSEQGGLPKWI
jgi:hypothetical protein